MNSVNEKIQKVVNKFGYRVTKYPNEAQRRRIKLLELNEIHVVIDVGANGGQFGYELRMMGYKGRILSFEPLSDAFQQLKKTAIDDTNWQVVNLALGDKDEESMINVSSNLVSSSILSMNNSVLTDAANVRFVGSEPITIRKLDTILHNFVDLGKDNLFIKIDAQGYEGKILAGADESMKDIKGVQIEMPLTEMYKGQMLFIPILLKMYDMGFELQGLEQGFHDPTTLQLYEIDGTFFRK